MCVSDTCLLWLLFEKLNRNFFDNVRVFLYSKTDTHTINLLGVVLSVLLCVHLMISYTFILFYLLTTEKQLPAVTRDSTIISVVVRGSRCRCQHSGHLAS